MNSFFLLELTHPPSLALLVPPGLSDSGTHTCSPPLQAFRLRPKHTTGSLGLQPAVCRSQDFWVSQQHEPTAVISLLLVQTSLCPTGSAPLETPGGYTHNTLCRRAWRGGGGVSPVPQGDAPLCSGLKVVLGKVLGGHQGGNPEPGHLTTESDGGRGAARDTLCTCCGLLCSL